jgi:hypothetical protein
VSARSARKTAPTPGRGGLNPTLFPVADLGPAEPESHYSL